MRSHLSDGDFARLEEQIFQSLAEDDPTPEAQYLVAAGLGISVTGLAHATAAGTQRPLAHTLSVSKVGKLVLVKWAGLGVVAGTVILGAAHFAARPGAAHYAPGLSSALSAAGTARTQSSTKTAPPSAIVLESGVTSHPAPPSIVLDVTAVAGSRPAEPSERAPERPLPSPLSPPAKKRAPAASENPVVAPPSALAAEIAVLDRTRQAIANKDVMLAQELLDDHARQFPDGTLKLEAAVLLVETLFLQGERDRAVSLGNELLRSHGTSPHAGRVRYLLSRYAKP